MTREEAKDVFLNRGFVKVNGGEIFDGDKWRQSVVVISEWLKQEPCEDAISRQAVLDMIYNVDGMEGFENSNIFAKHYVNNVKALPSVTPQSKVGRWIENIREDGCGELYFYWACSECGRDVGYNLANIEDVLSEYPYCHCGAKMEVNNC